MQARSGEGLDHKYQHLWQRGPAADRRLPDFRTVGRWSRVRWRYPFLRRDAKVWIRAPLRIGRGHQLAIVLHYGLLAAALDSEVPGSRNLLLEGLGLSYSLCGLALVVLLQVCTRFVPVVGPWFTTRVPGLGWALRLGVLFFLAAGEEILRRHGPAEHAERLPLCLVYAGVWGAAVVLPNLFRVRRTRYLAKNLLVLRVFGSSARSAFLFRRLQPVWNTVGSVFTISSPDQGLAAILGMRMSRLRLLAAAGLWLLVVAAQALALPHLDELGAGTWVPLVGLALVGQVALYPPCAWIVRGSFLQSEDSVYRRIIDSVREGRSWKGLYSNTYYSVHDDDWRTVIEGIAGFTDVVLIDLRGFTEERQGTAFELQFLVQSFPVENCVVLADRTTDMDAFGRVFEDAWRHMAKESPNARPGEKSLTIYRRNRLRWRDVFKLGEVLVNHSLRNERMGLDEETLRKA